MNIVVGMQKRWLVPENWGLAAFFLQKNDYPINLFCQGVL